MRRPARGHERQCRHRHAPPALARRAARPRRSCRQSALSRSDVSSHGNNEERSRMTAPARACRRLYETSATMRRLLLTVCVMMATIMQALDTTIANVALPYMQGSLATTQDQVNWVLTSYIVAAAIMTSPLGWMAARFGRKRLFIVCTAGFHRRLDAVRRRARSIEQMVAFRLLQGVFGAALVPLQPGGDARHLPARQARLGDGDLGHGRHARPDHGPDARRLAHRLRIPGAGCSSSTCRSASSPCSAFAAFMRGNADAARRALLLVRLLAPVARHRLVADDARPRRTARLVRVDRDLDRDDPRRSSASTSSSPTA